MTGISSKNAGSLENRKSKYNGYELNIDFDLNLYESFYRTHDPQIGRFLQIDPKSIDELSPFSAMANNPLLMFDPLGDTTTYYDERGNVLYTTLAGGYNNAFIVKNDWAATIKKISTDMEGTNVSLEGQKAIDQYLIAINEIGRGLGNNIGDVYDLHSISNFFDENNNSVGIKSIRGVEVDQMSKISIDGKSVTKEYLKGIKAAEVSFDMINVNGVWVVNNSSKDSYSDLLQGPRGSDNVPNGHTHNYSTKLMGKKLTYTYPTENGPHTITRSFYRAQGPSSGPSSDVARAKEQGKVSGTIRNIVVNIDFIYFYNGSNVNAENIAIKRR